LRKETHSKESDHPGQHSSSWIIRPEHGFAKDIPDNSLQGLRENPRACIDYEEGFEMKFEAPSWNDVYEMCFRLADEVRRSRFVPDIIVGVARGGWVPARIISDLLKNPNLANTRVEFYEDVGKKRRRPKITQSISTPVKDKKVLVVDDVSDTGESLRLVCEDLRERGASEVRLATMHYKPWSVKKPDYYIKETEAWIVYPYELLEFTKSMIKRLRSEDKSSDEIKQELTRIGLNSQIVDKFMSEF